MQREIAELTGPSTNTVNRIIQAYRNEGRICDAPHDRRPRVTSAIEDEVLVAAAYANPFGTAQQHAQLAGVSASLSTVKRRLAEAGLRSRVAVQKPLLSDDNKAARLRFASEHSTWSVDDWKQVLLSDESTFTTRWDQKRRVWRPVNTRYEPEYVQEVASSGRTTVNVWAVMSKDVLGTLHRIEGSLTAEKYSEILEYVMIPYALDGPFPDGDYLFQQDLAPVHTAKSVKKLLTDRGVRQLEWIPKGADVSIIEPVWGRIKVALSKEGLHRASADDLWHMVEAAWNVIKEDRGYVEALYASLPSRIQHVIAAKGGMTRY
ncbi:hypothetical protein HPB48_008061 [Haemaphysalis longicornis]|uniref:Transposase n=1 Tax=Haemaphysalis longicornis TaxID=44386 RepID=A0A9J6FTY7_HAELO|nr:hypothetical protein HPB48_008061 [Haemaphysalis longicornis]